MRALLYVCLVMSVAEFLTTVVTAGQPRDAVTKSAAVIEGIMVMIYAVALSLTLIRTDSGTVMILSSMLLVSLAAGVANFVRQAAGVRGEKTPLSTFVMALAGVFDVCAFTAILMLT